MQNIKLKITFKKSFIKLQYLCKQSMVSFPKKFDDNSIDNFFTSKSVQTKK